MKKGNIDHIIEDIIAQRDAEIADLRAQVEKLQADYAAEVAEMNAGYKAFENGAAIDDEPSGTRFDVWRIGWAWAKYNAEAQQ